MFRGGEEIEIEIVAVTKKALQMPAIGFTLVNRLGQQLLGENTLISRERDGLLSTKPGEKIAARFVLWFPMLPSGDYSIIASIADGTLENNIQHHWAEDAVLIRVVSSYVRYGLVGAFLKDASLVKYCHPQAEES